MDEGPIDLGAVLAPLRGEVDRSLPAPRPEREVRADGRRRRHRRDARRLAAAGVGVVVIAVVGTTLAVRDVDDARVDTVGTTARGERRTTGSLPPEPSSSTPPSPPSPVSPVSPRTTDPLPPVGPGGRPTIRVTTTSGASDFVAVPLACADGRQGEGLPECVGARDGFIGAREGSDLLVTTGVPAVRVRVAAMRSGTMLPPSSIEDRYSRLHGGEGALPVEAVADDDRTWSAPLDLPPGAYQLLVTVSFADGSEGVAFGILPLRPRAGEDPVPGPSALLSEEPQRCVAIPFRPTVLPSGISPTSAHEVVGGQRTILWSGTGPARDVRFTVGATFGPIDGEEIEVLGRRSFLGISGDVADSWVATVAWDQSEGCDMTIDIHLSGSRAEVDAFLAGLREVSPIDCPRVGPRVAVATSQDLADAGVTGMVVEGSATVVVPDAADCPSVALDILGVPAKVIAEDGSRRER